MEALAAVPTDTSNVIIPQGNWHHNQVFNSVSAELGKLEFSELHALIVFHGGAQHVRSDIQLLPSSIEEWEPDVVQAIHDHVESTKNTTKLQSIY